MTAESPAMVRRTAERQAPGIDPVAPDDRPRRIAAKRRIGRGLVISVVVVLFGLAVFIRSLVIAPTMEWGVVGNYLFSSLILTGLLHTIELTAVCEILAVVSGGVLAWLLVSGNVAWRSAVHAYQWFFRSVPELAQLIFWFNLSLLFPVLKIGIPFGGPSFGSVSTNEIITPWLAAVVGIGLHEGAYLAEVFRSGVDSVEPGQREAARALGLSQRRTFRRVVLPQAMWVIVPNAGSRLIGTLKITSLASVLAIQELLYTTESIYARTFQTIPLLLVATVWYMVCVAVLRVMQHVLERHYARAASGRRRWRAAPASSGSVLAESMP
jgi:polar amino acid transport system permease protein